MKSSSKKLRAIDLFCGAGGASMGLHMAGFEVVGVDIEDKSRVYPFKFIHADALSVDLSGFDFIWASPPCQRWCAYKRRKDHVKERLNLIPATRERLIASGSPYVIENVEGARGELDSPIRLCGSSFHLDVRRHRLFEANFDIDQPDCQHEWQTPRFPPATNRSNLRRTVEIGVWRIPIDVQRTAMGIGWMDVKDLSQSIPPAYARHIGMAAIREIHRRRHPTASS